MSWVLFVLLIIAIGGIYYLFTENKKLKRLSDELSFKVMAYERQYSGIINIDNAIQQKEAVMLSVIKKTEQLSKEYTESYQRLDEIKKQLALYEESLELNEIGVYEPHFSFDTSERYKAEIKQVRDQQKLVLKNKRAVICNTEWRVGESSSEGTKMINKTIKLTIKAFNGECDVAIANVEWNNFDKMKGRIEKAFHDINKINELNHAFIQQEYLNLKLRELQLAFEYKDKKRQEKEEQAELKRQMREEAKLEEEQRKAEKEEDKYENLLLKAQREASRATGDKMNRLNAEIAELEQKLAEAHAKSERAKSMAQQTRAGHVYIISNIGAFGENVYKIGMTRRLDPLERVTELSAASVPFSYDIHAMIYTDDAPTLETKLHQAFSKRRVNLVNLRKEFFSVSLDEIQREVCKTHPNADFITTAVAEDFRRTQKMRDVA